VLYESLINGVQPTLKFRPFVLRALSRDLLELLPRVVLRPPPPEMPQHTPISSWSDTPQLTSKYTQTPLIRQLPGAPTSLHQSKSTMYIDDTGTPTTITVS
jgi:hypothetical protein